MLFIVYRITVGIPFASLRTEATFALLEPFALFMPFMKRAMFVYFQGRMIRVQSELNPTLSSIKLSFLCQDSSSMHFLSETTSPMYSHTMVFSLISLSATTSQPMPSLQANLTGATGCFLQFLQASYSILDMWSSPKSRLSSVLMSRSHSIGISFQVYSIFLARMANISPSLQCFSYSSDSPQKLKQNKSFVNCEQVYYSYFYGNALPFGQLFYYPSVFLELEQPNQKRVDCLKCSLAFSYSELIKQIPSISHLQLAHTAVFFPQHFL